MAPAADAVTAGWTSTGIGALLTLNLVPLRITYGKDTAPFRTDGLLALDAARTLIALR